MKEETRERIIYTFNQFFQYYPSKILKRGYPADPRMPRYTITGRVPELQYSPSSKKIPRARNARSIHGVLEMRRKGVGTNSDASSFIYKSEKKETTMILDPTNDKVYRQATRGQQRINARLLPL